jgi:glutathione synthase/RimK-type ligase-like ATP-grasp enzyme
MKKTYVLYSAATDVTGKTLVERLKATGGTELPKEKVDVLLSWGAKTSKDITLDKNIVVLNHPNAIRKNRNKLEALTLMSKAKVPVGKFITAEELGGAKTISFPMIGRTKFHQGGKNFWLCLTKSHAVAAVKEGAQYFQEYMPIEKEYRMHVFGENVFYAAVKTQSGDAQKSFVESHAEKIKNNAEKAGTAIDAKTVEYTLEKIANRNQHSNPLLKSHAEGWVFKAVAVKDMTTAVVLDLKKIAVAAVKAVGLNFGAVDCGVTEDGKVVVLEVNSGPSLEGTSLDQWLTQITQFIASLEKTTTVKKVEAAAPASPEAQKVIKGAGRKESAIAKAELLRALLLNAEEEEADNIMSAAARMFAAEAKGAAAVFNKG